MRLAVFSDVHSNLPALKATLADIETAAVDGRYCLGDLVGYAPWPNEVLELLAEQGFPIVMGNYDDGTAFNRDECGCAYTDPSEKELGNRSFAWTKEHVTASNRSWLGTLEPAIRFEIYGTRFLLVHGSPRRINEYLYEDRPDSSFERIARMADADLIICGHTHRPYDEAVAGVRFVNVGSAGKPKDGDPRACWALIDVEPHQVTVEFRRVTYDVEAAAAAILASDLPHEFADQLREARGFHRTVTP